MNLPDAPVAREGFSTSSALQAVLSWNEIASLRISLGPSIVAI
jgi:hypothetical protein